MSFLFSQPAPGVLPPSSVSFPEIEKIPANTLLGNNTGSEGPILELNADAATALLSPMGAASISTGGAKGLVPESSAGDQLKFLRADGNWAQGTPVATSADAGKVLATDGTDASWRYAGLGDGNFLTDNVILGRSKPSGLSNVANIVIGTSPTGNALGNSAGNTLIGFECGKDLFGSNNTCIGNKAGTEANAHGIFSGSENVCIGNQAGLDSTHDAYRAVSIGTGSGADSYAVMIGSVGRARSYGIAIGSSARAWNSCINIGYNNCWNDYGGSNNFIVGNYARNPNFLTNICAFGGPGGSKYTTAYWGQGLSPLDGASLVDFKSTVTPASGTDQSAATGTFTIAGAQGTGSGVGGAVIIATAPAGVAGGSTANAHVERLRVTADGIVKISCGEKHASIHGEIGLSNVITATINNYYIGVDTSSAAITVNLPAVGAAGQGFVMVIKDETGNAATNAIVIDGNLSETIDGAPTQTINTNYGSVSLMCSGSAWFIM